MNCPSCHSNHITRHSKVEQRVRCLACGRTWSKRQGSPYFRLKHKTPTVARALELLTHKVSIRRTAQLLGVDPSTIQRWKTKFLT